MNSIYHILYKHPAIYQEYMQSEYEDLARELVSSGRLRIDTDYYCNFVHYNSPKDHVNVVFSELELANPDLLPDTKARLKKLYTSQRKHISDQEINVIMANLKRDLRKLLSVSEDLSMRLSRIFVQSAHPIVIKWLLFDKVEVFITYSHNIGDVMNIQDWKRSGTNSGMQSTDGKNVCIYVSCGGDPFANNNEQNPIYGDGWAAVARLQVIAAQEIGHFADIKRDHKGNQITRHSANFACTRATDHVKSGRRNDIARCSALLNQLLKAGMQDLIELEQKLRFYDKQKLFGINTLLLKFRIKRLRNKLLGYADKNKLQFLKIFNKEKYMGLMIAGMIEDMQSHLSPVADVYKRSDKEAEEAISCVEALARVPQQVMKWGYLTTGATMHDLYKVYYSEVIPSLVDNYNHLKGIKYKRNYHVPKRNFLQKILDSFLSSVSKKDKFKFTEVRDI